ncbi:peroxidase [Ranunculus cassubicifolius]
MYSSTFCSFLVIFFSLLSCLFSSNGSLVQNFYATSCPQLEEVVRNITWSRVASNASHAAKLLRLQFNDCFVKGCEASILLSGIAHDMHSREVEKDYWMNESLNDVYDVYDEIKKEVENQCPNTVSCADIVALVARDAVSYQYGKSLWEVQTGRRDGKIMTAIHDATINLPRVHYDIKRLEHKFGNKGLSIRDLVVLSGAHTIGVASCESLYSRLNRKNDPYLNTTYVSELKRKCEVPPYDAQVFFDPITSFKFDNNYYKLLKKNMGLLETDEALLHDERTAAIVDELAIDDNEYFLKEFGKSMVKLGAVGVLTGEDGEIRKKCWKVNKINN